MKLKDNSEINENLAELIGAFIGDGFLNKYGSHYHVEFTGNAISDKKYFELLSKIIKLNFNVNPRFKIEKNILRMYVTYKEFYLFLNKYRFSNGIKNKTVVIPRDLYESELVNKVVRGIFDTDGYIFVDKRPIYKKPYIRIGLTTKSKELFEQIKDLFLELYYKIYTRIDKRYNTYNIEIYGNHQIKRWLREFGFSNINKKNYASVAQLVER